MRILVTGATGFLGSHLLKALSTSALPVRAVYRNKIPSFASSLPDTVEWMQADILDVIALEEAMRDVSKVYHCAGLVSFNPKDKKRLLQTNVEGTANVINIALEKNIAKLIHVSSVAAIGRTLTNQHINEENKWEDSPNNSGYALSKYLGEMEVWRGIGEGLNAVIVNPTIILGPGSDWQHGSNSLFNTVYKEFPFYTTGVNGFVDVRDVVKAMVMLMESHVKEERFILNGDNWSYHKLFTAIANCLHVNPPHKKAAAWMGALVWRWEYLKSILNKNYQPVVTQETANTAQLKVYYETEKIKHYLPGFTFTPLEETISHTCQAFLESNEKK